MSFLKGLRFLKRIPLWSLFTINLSKSGLGFSFGPRGFRIGRTAGGKPYIWIGIPGTGIGYRKYFHWPEGEDGGNSRRYRSSIIQVPPETRRAAKIAKEMLRDEHERIRREHQNAKRQADRRMDEE